MAKLIKRNARKPLEEGRLTAPSWSNFRDEGELFTISVGYGSPFQLKFSRREAQRLRDDLQKILVEPEFLNQSEPRKE